VLPTGIVTNLLPEEEEEEEPPEGEEEPPGSNDGADSEEQDSEDMSDESELICVWQRSVSAGLASVMLVRKSHRYLQETLCARSGLVACSGGCQRGWQRRRQRVAQRRVTACRLPDPAANTQPQHGQPGRAHQVDRRHAVHGGRLQVSCPGLRTHRIERCATCLSADH
jgi:hypothetical protein